jgi:quinol monooxygenase YgiN
MKPYLQSSFSYWQTICYYICMILLIIQMKVLSEKRMELSQTIASLTESIRKAKGCRRCDFCACFDDENRLFLHEEWDTREDLMTHLNSEIFSVFRGATMNFLKEPYEKMFYNGFHPKGMSPVHVKE